ALEPGAQVAAQALRLVKVIIDSAEAEVVDLGGDRRKAKVEVDQRTADRHAIADVTLDTEALAVELVETVPGRVLVELQLVLVILEQQAAMEGDSRAEI